MDEYYGLSYKSSPKKIFYALHRSENSLEILNSSIPPKKMGIKLNEKGEIIIPKYFLPLIEISRKTAFEIISKNGISEIEKLVGKI